MATMLAFSVVGLHLQTSCVRQRSIRMSEGIVSVVGITPIGPFCPFRSRVCSDGGLLEEGMASLSSKAPSFMTELTRLQLEMQAGTEVDPDRVRKVASEMQAAQSEWEQLLARMGMTDDFQAREYKKMTQAHLRKSGLSLESIGAMVRWQADCMLAYADKRPPPFPPAGVDLYQMAQQAQKSGSSPMMAMGAASAITSSPFNGREDVFKVRHHVSHGSL